MLNTIKNFTKFYFDPEILTEEEAKEELREMGVDVERIEQMFSEFLRKLEAEKRFLEGEIKKENFEKDLEEFRQTLTGEVANETGNINRLAARNGEGKIEAGGDEELLDFLKKKNEQREKNDNS
ncbi:MAG: hypothetical protein N3E37_05305 [Candidatus Micrarchaeota archaeon]|nr:hypothetical protein [Candidatus Micrarchaeota archaeon]